ncbi:MFS transporter [Sphingomicrobium astaxanthinifaciens]|uniref:MFS transporter n=1 Tax=Sphingomicrobium astaxanthinifaciens TaxID=1227949 RepID=UPI001FCC024B|nr:MFS transporter [Sphingomicrobium astaxanthinifaciens]MCJ7421842.1 MFS transporter [Sphingomicrobium astaxanthinifaciens]
MNSSLALLARRRFAPLFAVQFLGAFNDNLFRTSMVLLVIFGIYDDPTREASLSAVAGGLFILPFMLFSAMAGSLADAHDKAKMIRRIKTAEVAIMLLGATGLLLQSVPLLLATLAATGIQSAFFGPIKYALLPQHLRAHEVLGGTGLVQAGTYVAILGGTLLGGALLTRAGDGALDASRAAAGVLVLAAIGRLAAAFVPPAPPRAEAQGARPDWHFWRAARTIVTEVMTHAEARRAIWAISLFWALGAVLLAQFPPLVKNALGGDEAVATAFLAIFSIGVALGSVAVNRLLGGAVSARYAPHAALGMALFILDLYRRLHDWTPTPQLLDLAAFLARPGGVGAALDLFGLALMGGAYVVPLYAFLTTRIPPALTARAVAVNNIVNAGLMVAGSLALTVTIQSGISIGDSLLGVAAVALLAALLGRRVALRR